MKLAWFVDIDDTLMQTAGKCPPGEPLAVGARDRRGEPHSYMTARQRALLSLLQTTGLVIPTTGRTSEALARVDLPFDSYRITGHGAAVSDATGPVTAWADVITQRLRDRRPVLEQVTARTAELATSLGLSVRVRLLQEGGAPAYVSLRGAEHHTEELRKTAGDLWSGLEVSRSGHAVALLPPEVRKHKAVAWVARRLREEHGELLTVALGDSLSDVPFMLGCDLAMLPRGSRIAQALEGVVPHD